MAHVYTTWTGPADVSGTSCLSGSDIWNCLEYIYSVISGYWPLGEEGSSAFQYLVTNDPITGLSAISAGVGAPGSYQLSALAYGTDWTSATLTSGFIVNLVPDFSADQWVGFSAWNEDAAAGWRWGFSSHASGGQPVGANKSTPAWIASAWCYHASALPPESLYKNLLRSEVEGAGSGVSGLGNLVFLPATNYLTGTSGWNDRFFQPYLGFKQQMKLYNDALYASAGITACTGGPSAIGGNDTASALLPITGTGSGYAVQYASAYYNVDELIYGWDTVLDYLTAVSAEFSKFDDHVPSEPTCGAFLIDSFQSAGSASNYAALNFVGSIGAFTGKLMFTGDETQESDIFDMRQNMYVAGLRMQWDTDNVFVPISSFENVSAVIWDESTKNVLLYLTQPITAYNVIREVISGL